MIAHIDADAFFASVLLRSHPHLKGKPLLAVGMGGGCVIAASYEAKAFGVKTGMRMKEARALVPNAIEMNADFRETGIASEQIEAILKNVCPIVEQMSIDEWFLDLTSLVGGTPNDPKAWAKKMQASVLSGTDISISIGIAASKLLAKMAGEYRKPAGVTVLRFPSTGCSSEPGGGVRGGGSMNIESFLKDRSAASIPGIGRKRMEKTDEAGIRTAWDLTQAPDALLIRLCGRPGVEMKRELLGESLFPVREDTRPPQSISRCRTFKATTDRNLLKAHLLKHLEYCTMKMRRQHLACRGISVHLRDAEYAYASAHRTFDQPCTTVSQMMPSVLSALTELMHDKRVNQVGLALHGLSRAGDRQQSIFEDASVSTSDEKLQQALDTLQTRFGRDSITRAAALPIRSGTKQELDFSLTE